MNPLTHILRLSVAPLTYIKNGIAGQHQPSKAATTPVISIIRTVSTLLLALILSGLTACISTERDTPYKYNLDLDREADRTAEETLDVFIDGIGQENYNDLAGKLGAETLDLLIYDTGVSNMVNLINEVIVCGGTADKLVDLLSATGASPSKIQAETALALITGTDDHLRNEPILPSGDNTIAKVANMVCKVNNMDDLVYIVNNTPDYVGAGSPPETEALARITLILALIDETEDAMPTIINEVADTAAGRDKLLRLLSEVDDLRDLATVMNDTDEIINLLTVVDLVDGIAPAPNGVDALVTTMNLITKPSDMAYMMNQLDVATNDINNDDNFSSGDLAYQNWATTGQQVWYVDSGDANDGDGFSARTNAALNDLEVSALELAADITVAGNVSFDLKTSTQAGDYLKFYIDDVLMGKWDGTSGWLNDQSFAVSTGTHRFRWEYVKDSSGTGGSDFVRIDDVKLPGDKGTARTASEKVAIMLNQLDITSQDSVGDILNGVNSDSYGYAGLDNLITVLNRVEYPLLITDEPRLVAIVNDITNINAMNELMRGLDANGTINMIEIVDHAPDVSQVADLVNQMDSGGLGTKTTDILNGLNSTGALNIAKLVDESDNSELITLIDQATAVSHMSDILNGVYLHGSPGTTTVSTSTGLSGGSKLADVVNRVVANPGLGVDPHLVRLVNDIAASPLGPQAVGEMIGLLDPGAVNYSGTERLVVLMDVLSANGSPQYTDPLSNSTTDDYGRVIELLKAMNTNGAWNLARVVNELDCNDIGNPNDCRVYNASDMVLDSNRVIYVSRLITEMTNVQLVIDLLNDPMTDFPKVQTLLNIIGDDTYGTATLGTPPVHTYDNIYEWPSTDDDYSGRLIMTINNIAGSQGISNMIDLVNGVNYVDGVNDDFNTLIRMIKETHRIVYMSRMVSDASDLTLVVDLINALDHTNAAEVNRLRDLVNTLGDNTYGVTTGVGSDPSPFYTDAMQTSTADEIGRMTIFINDLLTEAGGNQATAINNTVSMIKDAYDLNYVLDFIRGIDRIRYITNFVANIDNINLMMTIINGESGTGADGADLNKMLTIMNNYGGSTRFGANPTGKSIGEMTMFSDLVDLLGSGRPISDQARIIEVMNDVVYCGIKPSSDLTITGNGSASDFFNCDSHVDFDYEGNIDNVVYDQRHRVANIMLGLDNANDMAIIIGEVTDPTKTVRAMNGVRRINTLIKAVRWMPGEVSRDLINATNLGVMYSSFVFMANNMAPNEDEGAEAFAALIHYGTGIAGNTNNRYGGTCKYYSGFGPKRVATLMNIEPGAYLETILQMFGWRTGVAAMTCAFGTPNAGNPQTVSGSYGNGTFYSSETVYQNYPSGGSSLYTYQIYDSSACYTSDGAYDCNCDTWGCDTCYNWNYGYLKEKSGASVIITLDKWTDNIVWNGWAPFPGISVPAGLGGVWGVLKGEGIVGWLLSNSGWLAAPPVDTNQYGSPQCTNSSYGNEWDCIKHGKNSGDNISDYRWGNLCNIRPTVYTTPSSCESNGGRWQPDKHYQRCFVNPDGGPGAVGIDYFP